MIVIVEDDPIVLMHMKNVLEQEGHEVETTFSSGEALLDFMERASPDLVVMDIIL